MVSFEPSVFALMSTVTYEKETEDLNSIAVFIQCGQSEDRRFSTGVCCSRQSSSLQFSSFPFPRTIFISGLSN